MDEQRRLQKILQGAFSGPPTPLKDIPTRDGKQRAERKDQRRRPKRRQRKKRAA
jgi:hypothetical protein